MHNHARILQARPITSSHCGAHASMLNKQPTMANIVTVLRLSLLVPTVKLCLSLLNKLIGVEGYNKIVPPPWVPFYNRPTELGGAINASLDKDGHDTYMGFKYFPFSQSQGYGPYTCAAACEVQTLYSRQHPARDGSYQTCVRKLTCQKPVLTPDTQDFFNIYVLSKNAIPQGLYCSLYNQTWAPSYATNYRQYRGSDRYTVSRSYSYSRKSSKWF